MADGGFTPLLNAFLRDGRSSRAGDALPMYLALLSRADEKGICWPGAATLSEECRQPDKRGRLGPPVTENTIRRWRRYLKKIGYIKRYTAGSGRKSTRYVVALPQDIATPPSHVSPPSPVSPLTDVTPAPSQMSPEEEPLKKNQPSLVDDADEERDSGNPDNGSEPTEKTKRKRQRYNYDEKIDVAIAQTLEDIVQGSYNQAWHLAEPREAHYNQIRLLRESGNSNISGPISLERIRSVFRWLKHDDFWPRNLRSGAKFRKQFDALEAKSKESTQPSPIERTAEDNWENAKRGAE